MAEPTESAILEALKTVTDPDRGGDIVALGMVGGLAVKQGNVHFTIEVDPQRGQTLEPLRKAAEKAAGSVPGVLSVTAVLTAESKSAPAAGTRAAPQGAPRRELLPDVTAIVAVASGKGGVGKSTTAANIALALVAQGLRVGMLDADIYGPSMPMMLGIHDKPSSPDGKRLLPIEKFGMRCMSIGFLVPPDTPMIWRGPMVMGALEQMMGDVEWGPLDVLVVDMPPGTGDAQLTMAQRVPLAGAVIVSTPQDLALLDARKGLNMFRKVEVPVLGIVENMSYFVCPECGERSDIFNHGGARRAAEQMGVDFLGEIPLDMAIREGIDNGRPTVVADPDGPHAAAYMAIAAAIWDKVGGAGGTPAGPEIVIE
ncbi:MAG: iron-sulfur cluster carrier protein ApbC [Alphaproteobacteria bacterium]|nr:iron-sulfur cluster carrier protein ApbC [Alphaproteobacteria bacterium]